MSKLAFLKDITLVGAEKPKRAASVSSKDYNPAEDRMAIRLFYDGSVFPSTALVDRFNLEYATREVDNTPLEPIVAGGEAQGVGAPEPAKVRYKDVTGNGFDVADTNEFKSFVSPQRLLVVAVTPKAELKVDLFSSTGYEEDNTPSSSVLTQGSATFGKSVMIPMVEEVYGLKFKVAGKSAKPAKLDEKGNVISEEVPAVEEIPGLEFVDLALLGSEGTEASAGFRLPETKNIAFLPKRVSRGDKRGESTVARRENPELFVLMPISMVDEESAD